MKYIKNSLAFIGLIAIIGLLVQGVKTKDIVEQAASTPKPVMDTGVVDKSKVVGDYNVYALPLPEDINFAGESVPLENPDIRKRLDRELLVNTYWQSNALLMLKRAHQYLPEIEPILAKYGIPDDFKYLAVAESGLDQVVSPAGARGFWQFMDGSGRDYGLEINRNVDERYNIEKATEAAAKYLRKAKEKLGSWTLAAAAYNAGMRAITKQLDRQEVSNYYDLLLGSETSRYIFRIIALKEIMSHPHKYGFNFEVNDLYYQVPTYTVKVDTPVTNFARFAKHFGINYKILKIHNPWLRQAHLNNRSRKMYFIKIPKDGFYSYKP